MSDQKKLLAICDHTLLDRCATKDDIKRTIDEGIKYETASVCIPPCYVKFAKEYAKGQISLCTVIGFPNGYSTTEAKVLEAKAAVDDGADEVDMVINLGMVKDGLYDEVLAEINAIKRAVGDKILKVIIETCLLTEEEKIKLCQTVCKSSAEFIKTSTGFSFGGAVLSDVVLMAKYMTGGKKIKAAGGISSFEDAQAFADAGASRLGTSRLVKLAKNENCEGY